MSLKRNDKRSGGASTRPASPGKTHDHTLAEAFALAARVVGDVSQGASLSTTLAALKLPRPALRAATQDFSYNTLRAYGRVNALADRLTGKPLDDPRLYGLVLVSLAELMARPQSAHAVVHQAVEAASLLDLGRARGLVNAVLRRFQRESATLLAAVDATDEGRYCHPGWWIDRLRAAYPGQWEGILREGNAHPPMTLRVNTRKISVAACLDSLKQAGIAARPLWGEAILLERPVRVEALPGFERGEVSVQDAGAQHAPRLLELSEGMKVLDACAAPGGKAAHILEQATVSLTAVDVSPERVRRIGETLSRLQLNAVVKIADVLHPDAIAAGAPFERILLDAPCTASGVVRRHPDIKWLRREADLASFAAQQERLLEALWRVLAPDGKLLYVTCSVFPEENGLQIDAFLARHPEAHALPVAGIDGGQILPGPESDGFYYALLQKSR